MVSYAVLYIFAAFVGLTLVSALRVGYVFQNLGFTEAFYFDSCNQNQILLKRIKCIINIDRFNTLFDL